jgi:NDP-sugar pyrophosphorylase family protein
VKDSTLESATAVVLAGGLGTRLRSVVADRPKVLAEVRGKPFLAFLFDELDRLGLRHVVICSGYLGEQLVAAFGDTYRGLSLEYSLESAPLGTAGALRLALPYFRSETCLVMNGDSFCEADLGAFWDQHQFKNAAATILLTHVPDSSRYGKVALDEDGLVTKFEEKSAAGGPGWVNGGIYLLRTALLSAIAPGVAVSLERSSFPAWIGHGLYGAKLGGRFIDIGTPESYSSAQEFFSPRART